MNHFLFKKNALLNNPIAKRLFEFKSIGLKESFYRHSPIFPTIGLLFLQKLVRLITKIPLWGSIRQIQISSKLSLNIWLSTIFIFNYACSDMGNTTVKDRSYLQKNIAIEVADSIKIGLERYKTANGGYPIYCGEYFYNYIYMYINIHSTYLYLDSINIGEINRRKMGINIDKNRVTISIGESNASIIYCSGNGEKYFMYFKGTNGVDEQGKGDDLIL
jgi:hypothetical protein